MAKRRAKKRTSSRKGGSRKMNIDFMSIGGNIAGAIASKILVSKLPIQNNLIKSVSPIALGIFLSNNKNAFIRNAGLGMIAVGGSEVVKTIVPGLSGASGDVLSGASGDVLSGDDFPMLEGYHGHHMAGDGSYYATINGDSTSADYMAGTDEFIAGADDFMA
jgi:hypothetical protein